jgi:hypothetical protein
LVTSSSGTRTTDWILADEEGLSPHLHFPVMRHVKFVPGAVPGQLVPVDTPDPWGQEKYELDIATMGGKAGRDPNA